MGVAFFLRTCFVRAYQHPLSLIPGYAPDHTQTDRTTTATIAHVPRDNYGSMNDQLSACSYQLSAQHFSIIGTFTYKWSTESLRKFTELTRTLTMLSQSKESNFSLLLLSIFLKVVYKQSFCQFGVNRQQFMSCYPEWKERNTKFLINQHLCYLARTPKKAKICKQWSNASIPAIEALKGGESVFCAAKQYGVPRQTLGDWMSGKVILGMNTRPKTFPTRSEWIVELFMLQWRIQG